MADLRLTPACAAKWSGRLALLLTTSCISTCGRGSQAISFKANSSSVIRTSRQRGDVVTYHNDAARTGLNPDETILTPANVNFSQFGLLRTLAVDGKVDAEPLFLSNLKVAGQTQNVVFAVTEHDSVYAFNADTGARLWKTSILGQNENPGGIIGAGYVCNLIAPEIGITSTPVIDRSAGPNGEIFVVGMSQDASGADHQRLHALDVTTGAEMSGSPAEIAASYPGTGDNSLSGTVIFDPSQYVERAGLLLMNGAIYLGWTSHCDDTPYTGWLMAYSESTLAQTGILNLTPNGSAGAIWMSGAGLAADPDGYIYFLDANGTFDTTFDGNGFPSQGDFGNGFIKVSTSGGKLTVADFFEPYNTVAESQIDLELGSGGVIVLPDITDRSGNVYRLAVGAGKDSTIYVVNRDSMGKFNAQSNAAIYQQVTGAIAGVFSAPAYFHNTVYYGAVGDALKAFSVINAKLAATPRAQSVNAFPFPGTAPSVSANESSNGIVWAVENSSTAELRAFDARTLAEIYNSSQAPGGRDQFGNGNKFITPLIANGKVFIGTPSSVAEFGMLP